MARRAFPVRRSCLTGWRIIGPEEEPVLSHGDYCLPNLFAMGHTLSGFIDLGRAGTADRWQDIALCYRSLKHNADGTFGAVYEGIFPGASV